MTSTISRADLAAYMDMIFGYVESDEVCIALRGVPEKGTPKEGTPPDVAIEPLTTFAVDRILGHMQRWGAHAMAAFIVPAAVSAKALEDRHATEDRMVQFTTMLVDIDKGDTKSALAHATKHIGIPSMTVHSGGTTETGDPKLHVYWRLSEASDQIERIAAARKVLALKLGGDPSFGRSTQVIRIPGSIYGKGGIAKPCTIAAQSVVEYELDEILEAVDAMPLAQGVVISDLAKLTTPLLSGVPYASGKGLNFSAFKEAGGDTEKNDFGKAMVTDIAEGGDEDKNRWGQFNVVAGNHIRMARTGEMSIADAKINVQAWFDLHMKPKWPQGRFESEWKGLLNHDVKAKGPLPNPRPAPLARTSDMADDDPRLTALYWNVATRDFGKAIVPMDFIVDGLICLGKPHLWVAAGGVGKTNLMLELGVKVARAASTQEDQSFLGLNIAGGKSGSVVIFTAEDDQHDVNNRLYNIFKAAGGFSGSDHLYTIPMMNAGGVFNLATKEKNTDSTVTSREWAHWVEQLRTIPDIRLVILDTLSSTMHADENSSLVAKEWFRELAHVLDGLGAAVIVTHHIRKGDMKSPIKDEESMRAAVRGSGNLVNSFRATIGIWVAPEETKRLARLGLGGRDLLFDWNVVKTNLPDMNRERRSLLRDPKTGLLADVSARETEARRIAEPVQQAWIIHVVKIAAEMGQPFTKTGKGTSLFGRRYGLPLCLRDLTRDTFEKIVDLLLEDHTLAACDPHGKDSLTHLDVPDGPMAKMQGNEGGVYRVGSQGAWKPPEWERQWEFAVAHNSIVPNGLAAQTTAGGGASRATINLDRGGRRE